LNKNTRNGASRQELENLVGGLCKFVNNFAVLVWDFFLGWWGLLLFVFLCWLIVVVRVVPDVNVLLDLARFLLLIMVGMFKVFKVVCVFVFFMLLFLLFCIFVIKFKLWGLKR
jgi:hypothetical protein